MKCQEVGEMMELTLNDLRLKVWKRYKVGQTINMRIRTEDGSKIKRRLKAKIIKFNPHNVVCEINGCIETFTYSDMERYTKIERAAG